MDCDVTHHSINGGGWDVRGGLGSPCKLPSSTEERKQAPLSEVGFWESARQSRRGGCGAVWRGDACVAPARWCALHRHDEDDGGRGARACGSRPGATQASPLLLHTAPAPTRMPCPQRLLKWSQQKPTPENRGGAGGSRGACVPPG